MCHCCVQKRNIKTQYPSKKKNRRFAQSSKRKKKETEQAEIVLIHTKLMKRELSENPMKDIFIAGTVENHQPQRGDE